MGEYLLGFEGRGEKHNCHPSLTAGARAAAEAFEEEEEDERAPSEYPPAETGMAEFRLLVGSTSRFPSVVRPALGLTSLASSSSWVMFESAVRIREHLTYGYGKAEK